MDVIIKSQLNILCVVFGVIDLIAKIYRVYLVLYIVRDIGRIGVNTFLRIFVHWKIELNISLS